MWCALTAEEPDLSGAFEAIIVGRDEGLILGSSDLVDGFAEVLCNVESIVHELCIGRVFGGCSRVSRKHVCSDGLDTQTLLVCESLKNEFCG